MKKKQDMILQTVAANWFKTVPAPPTEQRRHLANKIIKKGTA